MNEDNNHYSSEYNKYTKKSYNDYNLAYNKGKHDGYIRGFHIGYIKGCNDRIKRVLDKNISPNKKLSSNKKKVVCRSSPHTMSHSCQRSCPTKILSKGKDVVLLKKTQLHELRRKKEYCSNLCSNTNSANSSKTTFTIPVKKTKRQYDQTLGNMNRQTYEKLPNGVVKIINTRSLSDTLSGMSLNNNTQTFMSKSLLLYKQPTLPTNPSSLSTPPREQSSSFPPTPPREQSSSFPPTPPREQSSSSFISNLPTPREQSSQLPNPSPSCMTSQLFP